VEDRGEVCHGGGRPGEEGGDSSETAGTQGDGDGGDPAQAVGIQQWAQLGRLMERWWGEVEEIKGMVGEVTAQVAALAVRLESARVPSGEENSRRGRSRAPRGPWRVW